LLVWFTVENLFLKQWINAIVRSSGSVDFQFVTILEMRSNPKRHHLFFTRLLLT
jgi:hypothetical protein